VSGICNRQNFFKQTAIPLSVTVLFLRKIA
jgi:hypothetical protein